MQNLYLRRMHREEVIAKLRAAEPDIRALGAGALFLYGSYARDEAGPGSDVDIFIDKDPSRTFGFHQFIEVYFKLQKGLGLPIGYKTRGGLGDLYLPDIEREAVRVF